MLWFQKKNGEMDPALPQEDQIVAETSQAGPADTAIDEGLGRSSCKQQLKRVLGAKGKGVVLKLYIENFKHLNEIFGYDYCEQLLAQIISYVKEKVGQPVYRYIGVEFILILENYSQGQAIALAEELLSQFEHVWRVAETDCVCSAQIGICSYTALTDDVPTLLKYLDAAVTKASSLGPNQVVCDDSSLHTSMMRRQAIARYLKTALENKEIEVRYRPTYDTITKRFTGAEFYMRIFIKDIGLVGANEFIPIAEDSGQIRAVEYFALNQVGNFIASLVAAEKTFDHIAFSVSPVLLLQEDFLEEVERVMKIYQIPHGKLMLEIEEDILANASFNINTMMQDLSDLGVQLVLKNFVSSYSSITSLLDLPIHSLKLERPFICQMETNPKSLYVAEGLIHIARNLELTTIAEGVETSKQVEALNCFECPFQQGFYYSPTVTQDVMLQVMGTTLEDSRQIIAREKENMRRQYPGWG